MDVGDISKAKKLLGMSPPVDVSGPAYDNYMAYIQSPKFNSGMTKDGRSPVCKMDSAKKGLNVAAATLREEEAIGRRAHRRGAARGCRV